MRTSPSSSKGPPVRLITLNAGLLRIEWPGGLKLFEPAPWVAERAAHLPQALLAHPADVVFLQEIYLARHKDQIARQLSGLYPHAAYFRSPLRLRLLPDSLMILSRYPLAHVSFIRFKAGRWDERLLDTKGFLIATADVPHWGRVLFANVHTTAGVFTHPEDPRVDAVREAQLRQIHETVGNAGFHFDTSVLAGDFNCGPPASIGNYNLVSTFGYADVYADLALPEQPTWSPTDNALNRGGEHAAWGCPPQRIDHVFCERGKARGISGGIFLREDAVPVPGGGKVPLSDHYGLRVELEVRSAATAGSPATA